MASFPLLISAKQRHSPTFIPSFFDNPFFLDIYLGNVVLAESASHWEMYNSALVCQEIGPRSSTISPPTTLLDRCFFGQHSVCNKYRAT